MHRVLIASALALASAPLAAEEPAAPAADGASEEPLPALDEEEYAVLRALLLAQGFDAVTLVIEPTIPARASGGRTAAVTLAAGDGPYSVAAAEAECPDLEQTTVESFVERNRAGGRLEQRFGLPKPVVFLAEGEVAGYWKGRGCEAGWAEYRKAHPASSGIMSVSRVGINHDRTQALVYFGGQGHCLAGGGALYELEKFRGRWQVVQVVHLWVS